MTGEILFGLLMGHFWGDYLTQDSWMAFNKKKPTTEGMKACISHCLVYTTCISISLALGGFYLEDLLLYYFFITLIFLSHYIIDRYQFVEWWLENIKARSWNTHVDIGKDSLTTKESMFLSFGAIVYVVADNTLHLTLMWLILKFFV